MGMLYYHAACTTIVIFKTRCVLKYFGKLSDNFETYAGIRQGECGYAWPRTVACGCARLCPVVLGGAFVERGGSAVVRGRARFCAVVRYCALLCAIVRGCARLCAALRGCARLCAIVPGCARLCSVVRGRVR